MTHFSSEVRRVRIDIFKPTGKWAATEAILWWSSPDSTWSNPGLIFDEFKVSVRRKLGERYTDMTIVCLNPCHPNAHPLLWQGYKYLDA